MTSCCRGYGIKRFYNPGPQAFRSQEKSSLNTIHLWACIPTAGKKEGELLFDRLRCVLDDSDSGSTF